MALPETRYSLLIRLADPVDAAAWSEFCQLYGGAVYRYARGRGLSDADAEDVVQEVWSVVHEKVAEWRPTQRPGSFRAWLSQTAQRVTLAALRKRYRRAAAVGGTSFLAKLGAVPSSEASDDEQEWRLWTFAWAAGVIESESRLETWEAFRRTAIAGEPPADVARQLGLSVGSVYAAKCRVIARIRQIILESTGDQS